MDTEVLFGEVQEDSSQQETEVGKEEADGARKKTATLEQVLAEVRAVRSSMVTKADLAALHMHEKPK